MPLDRPETAAVTEAIAACAGMAGALMPLLHHIQDRLGYIPAGAVGPVADALNLSQADVHGVISFYHDFRAEPPGRHVLKLCRAEACQAMGAAQLVQQAERVTGVAMGHTAADGTVTLEAAYCLGLCASAPAGSIDGKLVARLRPAALDRILTGLGGGR